MFLKRLTNRALAPFQLFYWRVTTPQAEGAKILIEHGGKYLLIRETVGQRNWTLPGGRARGGEEPAETARRKAIEEAGVVVDDLTALGSYFHTRQGKKDVICAFLAKVDSPLYRLDPNIAAEAGWYTITEIMELERSESVDDVLELYTKYRNQK
ncbi:MAG TPA: NUDIX domain-containing protein [Candidatus Paceibacterota bacterium]|nr:NUDIX domain-containing protein [Candidatus Paceibacterota bacterium]